MLVRDYVAVPATPNRQSLAAFTATGSETAVAAFEHAIREALELTDAMVEADEGDPIDPQTLAYAIQSVFPFVLLPSLSCPVILPLQNGGVGTEWHDFGLNIELRFRRAFELYAVIEDARNIISGYRGRDPNLRQSGFALREFSRRSALEQAKD